MFSTMVQYYAVIIMPKSTAADTYVSEIARTRYNDTTWASFHVKSQMTRLFVEHFVQTNIQENIYGHRYGPSQRTFPVIT